MGWSDIFCTSKFSDLMRAIGYILTQRRGGSTARLQLFLIASTCLLYLVAAGLMSRAVWSFETNAWSKAIGGEADEMGDGPGSYDISNSVWHVNVSWTPYQPCAKHSHLTLGSAAVPTPTAALAGAFSMPFLAGQTRPPTAPLYRTTCTGLP